MSDDFDFAAFVSRAQRDAFGLAPRTRYAYAADAAMMRTFSRVRPVELAVAALVRASKEVLGAPLLGQAVKVGPRQLPRLHAIATRCAETLAVPVPELYVVNRPVVNAYTFGTDTESFLVLHSALVDAFDDRELAFVIGHETGHIQNKHVVYGTALQVLTRGASAALGVLVEPARLALTAWYRRAEITCDRAGLLCARDLSAGVSAFVKLALGSPRLAAEVDVDAYLEQLDASRGKVGRYVEALATHPYLPKRIRALRVFAESRLYREATGSEGGLEMDEVDARTSEIVRIDGGAAAPRGEGP